MSRIDQMSGVAIFVEAARTGGFSAAAERLGISKSAVGKSIARLEHRLGTRLFYRTTRRSSLTLDGETYLASCASALDEIAAAEAALDAGRFKPRGRVRIDMPGAFGRGVIFPVLIEIAKTEPDLRLAVSFTDRIVDLVEEGIDLSIRIGPLQDSTGLIARKLTEQTLVICASSRYLAARGTPTSLDDLQSHDCIVGMRREAPATWVLLDGNGATTHLVPPQTHQIGDANAICAAALADCGLSLLPGWIVRDHLASGALVAVLDGYFSRIDVHAIWPRTRHLVPRVRYVVDVLVAKAGAGLLD